MEDDKKIYISLEEIVNNVANRQHMSKLQRETMYKEWANLTDTEGVVKFNDKGEITGFSPNAAINKVDIKIMIDPESGDIDIV